MPPTVELLFWAGCPSYPRALRDLGSAMETLGLERDQLRVREITTQDEAERAGFTGSPTILVDGRDVAGSSADPIMLACRVYRLRDGRVSPVPDPEDVRDALRSALARATTAGRDR